MQLITGNVSLSMVADMLAFFPQQPQTQVWFDSSPAVCEALNVNTGVVSLNCGTLLPVLCKYSGKRGRILIETSALLEKGVAIVEGKKNKKGSFKPLVPKPHPHRPLIQKPIKEVQNDNQSSRQSNNNNNGGSNNAKPLIYQ